MMPPANEGEVDELPEDFVLVILIFSFFFPFLLFPVVF